MSGEYETLRGRLQASQNNAVHAGNLANQLVGISLDFAGNNPGDFFGVQGANLCAEFLTLARERGRPPAGLSLRAPSPPRLLAESERHGPGLHTIWQGAGYFIGRVVSSPGFGTSPARDESNKAYLCTDGRLRCYRSAEVFPSTQAAGTGTIPTWLRVAPGYYGNDDSYRVFENSRTLSDALYRLL